MNDRVAEAVQDLLPRLAERAPEVDLTGEISEQMMAELIDTGIIAMFQPKWCGGLESDPTLFYDAIRSLSSACGSTGWVAAALGVSPWHVALFDERAQREVWSDGTQALVCSSYAPVGRLVPVEGGYELSGHWNFPSASAYASWALLGATVVGDNAQPVDIVSALVPESAYRIENVWDSVGLRGSGSNDLYVDRIFVPQYRTLRNYDVALRRVPGQKLNPGPLYRMPLGTIFNTAMTTPLIGLAEGCTQAFLARMRDRSRLSLGGANLATDQFGQIAAARATSEIDAAVLQVNRNIREMYECARRRADISMELRLQARRDQAYGAERAVGAIDLILEVARGLALRRGNPIERAWRDAHTGAAHAANDVGSSLALWGRGAFGLPVDEMLV